jgi:2'-5' RNA ligase
MVNPLLAGAARARPQARALRLFVALWPDAQTQERLHAEAARFAVPGRRLPARNLHVTLAFVGSVAASRTRVFVRVMLEARPRAFELVLERPAFFARSRVLGVAPANTPPELAAYHQRLSAGLAAAGLRVEQRAFHPHITLLRDAARPAPAQMVALPPTTLSVREIALVCSELSPGGARYEVINRVPAPASGAR